MFNKKNLFLFGFLFLASLFFVYAASTATNLIFNNNATSPYDEGEFFVNWTAGVDAAANYSIYIFSNNTFYLKANNDSVRGYSFSNTTEANYSFIVEAVNATGFGTNSTTNISIYVDSTVPTIALPEYINGTFKKNTTNLTLNISLSDALSGLTGSACLVDVNGTNQSVSTSNGWCNSTTISLSGLAEGNHTIDVHVNDTVNNLGVNNSFIVQIDSTAPVIALPNWDNSTLKRNTQNIILNISLSDALSGLTNAVCLVDVNGTNQTVALSSGWCNSTTISLSGLADGNHTIDVHVNDTVNNLGVNNSFSVQIDTTAPTPGGLTLSTSSINSLTITFSGADGTCTSSGTGTKSVSGSTLSVTGLSCGTSYAYTLTCTDTAGNAGTSSSTSFTTTGCGGGSYISSFWSNTFVVNEDQFKKGFTQELPIKNRIKVKVDEAYHHIGVIELTGTTVKINITSDPQQATLNIGDSRRFELTGDSFYDLLVTLNSIENNKAQITILSISEKMTEETVAEEESKEEIASEQEEIEVLKEEANLTWLWILLGLIVIVGILYFFKDKLKKSF